MFSFDRYVMYTVICPTRQWIWPQGYQKMTRLLSIGQLREGVVLALNCSPKAVDNNTIPYDITMYQPYHKSLFWFFFPLAILEWVQITRIWNMLSTFMHRMGINSLFADH